MASRRPRRQGWTASASHAAAGVRPTRRQHSCMQPNSRGPAVACDRAEPPTPEALRQLRRLPACRWLRTQPRRQRRAAIALAGVEQGRTGWIPAPLPRSGGGAGRLHGQWSQFGLAVAAAKPHGGGVEGRGNRNSQLSPGVHRSGTAGGGPRVSGPGDRSASDLGGLRAISMAAPTPGEPWPAQGAQPCRSFVAARTCDSRTRETRILFWLHYLKPYAATGFSQGAQAPLGVFCGKPKGNWAWFSESSNTVQV